MIMFVLGPLSRADPSVRVPGVVEIERGDIPNPLLASSNHFERRADTTHEIQTSQS